MQRRWARLVGCLVAAAAVMLQTTPPVLSPRRMVLMEPLLAVAADQSERLRWECARTWVERVFQGIYRERYGSAGQRTEWTPV